MQALTIASIVEKEVKGDEMPLVAGVIMNRLDKKMPLQMDSTVMYIHNISGRWTTTDKERQSNSPYNTYKVKGLPPGPISNPGKAALLAAINPTQHEYLYFVLIDPKTGKTAFAKTNEEHEANRKKFQQWCQKNPGVC